MANQARNSPKCTKPYGKQIVRNYTNTKTQFKEHIFYSALRYFLMDSKSDLSSLRNIGPTIQKRLQEIGINSKSDLKKMGPVLAYQKIQSKNPGKTILYVTIFIPYKVHWTTDIGMTFHKIRNKNY